MQMAVDGNNFFHTGWLARFLGLPRTHPSAKALKNIDVSAFNDGWDTCDETPSDSRYEAYYAMKRASQAYAGWIDDDGEDVVLPDTALDPKV